MNYKQIIILGIFILLGNYGCGSKKHVLHGKWYQSSSFFLEFRSGNTLLAEQQPGLANSKVLRDSGTYQIMNDTTLTMHFLREKNAVQCMFKINDSLLLLVHPYREVIDDKEVQLYDSALYHRNSNYSKDQIIQLYKLGKITE